MCDIVNLFVFFIFEHNLALNSILAFLFIVKCRSWIYCSSAGLYHLSGITGLNLRLFVLGKPSTLQI